MEQKQLSAVFHNQNIAISDFYTKLTDMFDRIHITENLDEIQEYQEKVDDFLSKISPEISARVIVENFYIYYRVFFNGKGTAYFLDKDMKIIYWKEVHNLYLARTVQEMMEDLHKGEKGDAEKSKN